MATKSEPTLEELEAYFGIKPIPQSAIRPEFRGLDSAGIIRKLRSMKAVSFKD